MTAKDYQALREPIGSQVAVAKALGISERTVQRRERGKMKITREAELALHFMHTFKEFSSIFNNDS